MCDKRKVKRRHLIYYLSVFEQDTNRLIGQLVDITTRGFMLTSENSMETGVHLKLRMVLPDVIEGDNHIMFEATSVWCKKDVNPNFWAIGFEYDNVSPKTTAIIDNLIQEFSFLD